MIAHVALGLGPIPPLDRLEDCLVEGESMIAIHELRGQHHHVHHRTMDNLEKTAAEPIARAFENGAMKQQIGFDDPELVSPRSLNLGYGLPQHQDLLARSLFSRLGSKRRFDHQARFDQFLRGCFVQKEKELHRFGEYGRSVAVKVGTVADALRDDTHHFENLHHWTQRSPAHTEVKRKLALGRKLIAGRERSLADELLKTQDQPVGEIALVRAG